MLEARPDSSTTCGLVLLRAGVGRPRSLQARALAVQHDGAFPWAAVQAILDPANNLRKESPLSTVNDTWPVSSQYLWRRLLSHVCFLLSSAGKLARAAPANPTIRAPWRDFQLSFPPEQACSKQVDVIRVGAWWETQFSQLTSFFLAALRTSSPRRHLQPPHARSSDKPSLHFLFLFQFCFSKNAEGERKKLVYSESSQMLSKPATQRFTLTRQEQLSRGDAC